MRFDPKLITPDDAPLDACGEIELPDDLAELAAQLRDDAAFLAERYPASRETELACPPVAVAKEVAEVSGASQGNQRAALTLWMGLGMTSALVLLISIVTFRPNTSQPVDVVERPVFKPVIAPLDANIATAVKPESASHNGREDFPRATPPAASPALFLNGVSGPELEGLMDLWQNDGEQDLRIEI